MDRGEQVFVLPCLLEGRRRRRRERGKGEEEKGGGGKEINGIADKLTPLARRSGSTSSSASRPNGAFQRGCCTMARSSCSWPCWRTRTRCGLLPSTKESPSRTTATFCSSSRPESRSQRSSRTPRPWSSSIDYTLIPRSRSSNGQLRVIPSAHETHATTMFFFLAIVSFVLSLAAAAVAVFGVAANHIGTWTCLDHGREFFFSFLCVCDYPTNSDPLAC